MNLLPPEILTKIYEYDPTYRTYMTDYVFPYIHQYISYTCKSLLTKKKLFLIIHKDFFIVTDSMTNPNFISINHHFEELFLIHFTDKQRYYLKSEEILFLVNYSFLKCNSKKETCFL